MIKFWRIWRGKRLEAKLLDPGVVEAAAKAYCDSHVGGPINSIWESPLTHRAYRMEQMRAALVAVGVKITGRDTE